MKGDLHLHTIEGRRLLTRSLFPQPWLVVHADIWHLERPSLVTTALFGSIFPSNWHSAIIFPRWFSRMHVVLNVRIPASFSATWNCSRNSSVATISLTEPSLSRSSVLTLCPLYIRRNGKLLIPFAFRVCFTLSDGVENYEWGAFCGHRRYNTVWTPFFSGNLFTNGDEEYTWEAELSNGRQERWELLTPCPLVVRRRLRLSVRPTATIQLSNAMPPPYGKHGWRIWHKLCPTPAREPKRHVYVPSNTVNSNALMLARSAELPLHPGVAVRP
jgi:hypothetical protein